MTNESRTDFVNRVLGLSLRSTQGRYSYCNDHARRVLFSLDVANLAFGDLILSPKWSKRSYAHSLKHINKIRHEGYELLVFKTKTRQDRAGNTVSDGFIPLVEKRVLVVEQADGDEYFRALPEDRFASEEIFVGDGVYFEGAKKTIVVNAYERDAAARLECVRLKGCKCSICGFCFEEKYGGRGKGFIHIHHVKPLSDIRDGYEVSPQDDLIPVCPNCHAMLHRHGRIITPQELKEMMAIVQFCANQKSV